MQNTCNRRSRIQREKKKKKKKGTADQPTRRWNLTCGCSQTAGSLLLSLVSCLVSNCCFLSHRNCSFPHRPS
ncbi:hypothetical protein BDV24DRAFT_80213 [Aspergillus arachidicola]|uniref:Uncharacterized protein n=1 Tax=Aspergillus arachidicola TaxID=656916 RepID=A0A5N6YPH9_9EURO|nr:hypothetical protein BDV24DRAFT_80213 [Aspergillus arachidicola]